MIRTWSPNGVRIQLWVCVLMVAGVVMPAAAQEIELVPFDAMYRYLSPNGAAEDPGDANPDFDQTWFTPAFDDSQWDGPTGGPFEYGTVNYIFNDPDGLFPDPCLCLTEPPSGDRYTNYFRHEFTTPLRFSNLGLDILADDGAVVYLDGQEVHRLSCCETPEDDYLTHAFGGNENGTQLRLLEPDVTLPPGDHVLAVSVHQSSTDSSDLGLAVRLLANVEPPPPPAGIATYLTQSAKGGPDGTYGFELDWEWDNSDGGGQNHGLLWFNIPPEELAEFGNGTATLQMTVTGDGDSGNMHRMTVDWLSSPQGGVNVSWNNIPDGPGVVPGQNAEATESLATGGLTSGDTIELDVTADVLAWASGTPNYGWGIVPTGGNGTEIASFEASPMRRPQLILEPGEPIVTMLQAGDADMDLDFDQLDLVKVQVAAKYLTGQAATWGDGDWNSAPGGSPGNPPTGDGVFNQFDIIVAQLADIYLSGPYAAVAKGGSRGDGQTSIVYDPNTGEVAVDAPAGSELTSINIDSAAGIFTGDAAQNLGGSFDNDADNNIFKATFGSSFGSLTFGNVAQAALSEDFLASDLTVVGSLAGGGDLGNVDLIYVPEPTSSLLVFVGAVLCLATWRTKRVPC